MTMKSEAIVSVLMKSQAMFAMMLVLATAFVGASGCAQLGQTNRPAGVPIAHVKQIAGTWQGWVTSQLGGQSRVTMTIKEDGDYEGATTMGSTTVGRFYVEDGKLRYRSSRTQGTATVSEDRGKTVLTINPEGTYSFETGTAVYERVK
jgi:hypothetical protein